MSAGQKTLYLYLFFQFWYLCYTEVNAFAHTLGKIGSTTHMFGHTCMSTCCFPELLLYHKVIIWNLGRAYFENHCSLLISPKIQTFLVSHSAFGLTWMAQCDKPDKQKRRKPVGFRIRAFESFWISVNHPKLNQQNIT